MKGRPVFFDITGQSEKETRSATRLRHLHDELSQDLRRRVVGRLRFLTRLPSLPANFIAATNAATSPRTDADATIGRLNATAVLSATSCSERQCARMAVWCRGQHVRFST